MSVVPVSYKVAEPYAKGKSGIRAPDAAVKYGSRMLTLGEAYLLFGNKELWEANRHLLERALAVWTRTSVAVSKLPLGESIEKDGDRFFLPAASDGITWRRQMPERLLDSETLRKPGQLFIVEKGVKTIQEGANEYTDLVGENNDMRVCDLPNRSTTKTTDHPLLFGNIGKLIVNLWFPDLKDEPSVHVGLANASSKFSEELRLELYRYILVPCKPSEPLGVLAYEPQTEPIQK